MRGHYFFSWVVLIKHKNLAIIFIIYVKLTYGAPKPFLAENNTDILNYFAKIASTQIN